MKKNRVLTAVLVASLLTLTGCKKEDAADSASEGASFASQIVKTWTSACMSGNDLIDSGNTGKYQLVLTLYANGSFSYSHYWYNTSCTGAEYRHIYSVWGTYAVGSAVGGLTDTYDIAFTSTDSEIMPMGGVTIQNPMNNDCGGSSPLAGGASAGHHYSTYMANCQSMDFPNSGSNKIIDNIVTVSNGVLSMGATYNGIPGVFHGDPIPGSTTVSFQ